MPLPVARPRPPSAHLALPALTFSPRPAGDTDVARRGHLPPWPARQPSCGAVDGEAATARPPRGRHGRRPPAAVSGEQRWGGEGARIGAGQRSPRRGDACGRAAPLRAPCEEAWCWAATGCSYRGPPRGRHEQRRRCRGARACAAVARGRLFIRSTSSVARPQRNGGRPTSAPRPRPPRGGRECRGGVEWPPPATPPAANPRQGGAASITAREAPPPAIKAAGKPTPPTPRRAAGSVAVTNAHRRGARCSTL